MAPASTVQQRKHHSATSRSIPQREPCMLAATRRARHQTLRSLFPPRPGDAHGFCRPSRVSVPRRLSTARDAVRPLHAPSRSRDTRQRWPAAQPVVKKSEAAITTPKRGFPAAARLCCGLRVALSCAPPRVQNNMHEALIRAAKGLCQCVKCHAAPLNGGRTFYLLPCAMLLNFAAHATAPALCTNKRWYAPRGNRRPVPRQVKEFQEATSLEVPSRCESR
jgi:hypothetical protein